MPMELPSDEELVKDSEGSEDGDYGEEDNSQGSD